MTKLKLLTWESKNLLLKMNTKQQIRNAGVAFFYFVYALFGLIGTIVFNSEPNKHASFLILMTSLVLLCQVFRDKIENFDKHIKYYTYGLIALTGLFLYDVLLHINHISISMMLITLVITISIWISELASF